MPAWLRASGTSRGLIHVTALTVTIPSSAKKEPVQNYYMGCPTELLLPNGVVVPLFVYDQLDLLNRSNLQRRALDLHKISGPELSPRLPGGTNTAIVAWIIDLQCRLATAIGTPLTPADFGVPSASEGTKFPDQHRKQPFSPWEHNVTTAELQFQHGPSFVSAAATAREEQDANRKMHRGTLDTFLFNGGDEPVSPKNPSYKVQPPFQTDPRYGKRPNTATGKASVTQTSYAPPPPEAYARESQLWEGDYIGSINSDVAPALPPLKR